MSEHALERTEPAAPFEFTALDLFDPYIIRDGTDKDKGQGCGVQLHGFESSACTHCRRSVNRNFLESEPALHSY